ncbi:MAG: hypothetical protein DI536_14885 [Archangium gephyra]|uniref:Blue (type 1) copper domain-containing protein n=1 Tax=Archangium gephyra TaxID=48 RepID=A0A2W5VQS0_9BACT|nr:MAG: hypothetical protein DI536_14885 [Archangium gephyra]
MCSRWWWLTCVALAACGEPVTKPDGGSVEVIHNCTEYVDRSAEGAARQVSFGSANDSPALGYAPKCITIARGQSVTFSGNFNTHPLSPGAFNADAGSPGNPITRKDTGADDLVVVFPEAGLYPYYCDLHAPTMVGVVQVR